MSYLDDVEKELRNRLGEDEDPEYAEFVDDVIKFVREKLLESYKNGVNTERNKGKSKNRYQKRASK